MDKSNQALITVSDVQVTLQNQIILSGINLIIRKGEIVTLIGPNGAGKSTLVRTLLGLLQPTHGSIKKESSLRIGYMPQKLKIDFYMPLSVQRFLLQSPKASKAKIKEIAKEVGIQHLLSMPIQSISGGELQRVLLARALLNDPELLVLDEPAQGVDVMGQEELYQLIVKIRDTRHCGILMVSHDLHLVMAGTDSVICLNKHICCSGLPADVTRHPEYIKLFGLKDTSKLAIYTHHHNHRHDIGGEVCH